MPSVLVNDLNDECQCYSLRWFNFTRTLGQSVTRGALIRARPEGILERVRR